MSAPARERPGTGGTPGDSTSSSQIDHRNVITADGSGRVSRFPATTSPVYGDTVRYDDPPPDNGGQR